MSGNALESVRERIRLENLLSDPNARHDNHRAIWAALATLSVTALDQLRLAPPPDVLSGWMELAVIAKTTAQDATVLQKQIDGWAQRYPQHPAIGDIVARLLGKPESVSALPAGGAVIPRSSPYCCRSAATMPMSRRPCVTACSPPITGTAGAATGRNCVFTTPAPATEDCGAITIAPSRTVPSW